MTENKAGFAEPPAPTPQPGVELPDVQNLRRVWQAHVEATDKCNAAIPPVTATNAEREVYKERYRAKGDAEREWISTAIRFAQSAADLPGVVQAAQDAELADLRQKLEAERQRAEKAERERDEQCIYKMRNIKEVVALRQQLADVTAERDAWVETAKQHCHNEDYYRGLVVAIGEAFGEPAYISDDGSKQEDVLCAKVPELVKAELTRLTAENQRLAAEGAAMLTVLREHGVGVAGDNSEYCVYCDYSENGKVAHRPTCILSSSTAGTVLLAENQRLRETLEHVEDARPWLFACARTHDESNGESRRNGPHSKAVHELLAKVESALAQPAGEPTP